MNRYEYEISTYPADLFQHLVFFCSEQGACSIDKVPDEQTKTLKNILNERGEQGWEMIQTNFGKDGLLIFWKRQVQS